MIICKSWRSKTSTHYRSWLKPNYYILARIRFDCISNKISNISLTHLDIVRCIPQQNVSLHCLSQLSFVKRCYFCQIIFVIQRWFLSRSSQRFNALSVCDFLNLKTPLRLLQLSLKVLNKTNDVVGFTIVCRYCTRTSNIIS